MQTVERFHQIGLETPQEVIAGLAACPRSIHASGIERAAAWRILVCIGAFLGVIYIDWLLWVAFVETGAVWSWCLGVTLIPVVAIFLPWKLYVSFRDHLRRFRKFSKIYAYGRACCGNVNTISHIVGYHQDCNYVEHDSWMTVMSRVRIDYTFEVDHVVKCGTMIARGASMRYLTPNAEVCVLYLEDDSSQSMLFPIPGKEFF